MSEDTPDDVVHTALLRGAVPRPPARPRDARRARSRSTAMARDAIAGVPRASGTARPTWSSPAAGDLAPRRGGRPRSTALPGRRRAGRRARADRARRPTSMPLAVVAPAHRAGPRGHGLAGARTTTTPTATPSGSPTRCSVAACRAGCSRRSARSGASPTRCSRRRRPTATPARSRSTPAPRRAGSASCSRSIDDVIDGLLADGITDEEHEVALGLPRGLDAARPRGQRQPHGPPRRRA